MKNGSLLVVANPFVCGACGVDIPTTGVCQECEEQILDDTGEESGLVLITKDGLPGWDYEDALIAVIDAHRAQEAKQKRNQAAIAARAQMRCLN